MRRILRIAVGQGGQPYAGVLGGNLRLLGSGSSVLHVALGPMRRILRIAAICQIGFSGAVGYSVHRQERPPKETIDVSGLPFLPPNPFHFDQGKWLRRIPTRVVLKLLEVGLELTDLHNELQCERGFQRKTLRTLALVSSKEDPKQPGAGTEARVLQDGCGNQGAGEQPARPGWLTGTFSGTWQCVHPLCPSYVIA